MMIERKIQLKPEDQAKILDYIDTASNAGFFNRTPWLAEMFKGFIQSPTFTELSIENKGLTFAVYEEIRQFLNLIGDIVVMDATDEFYTLPGQKTEANNP